MSGLVNVRAALETALNGMSPSLATAWESVAYTPTAGTAYQRVWLMPARPVNNEISANYREQGILQIDLCYPLNTGPAAAATRAELIRSTFKRGNSFTSSGVTAVISDVPEIRPGRIEGDRYVLQVDIRFYAHVTAS